MMMKDGRTFSVLFLPVVELALLLLSVAAAAATESALFATAAAVAVTKSIERLVCASLAPGCSCSIFTG
jgi:hypothetical protein